MFASGVGSDGVVGAAVELGRRCDAADGGAVADGAAVAAPGDGAVVVVVGLKLVAVVVAGWVSWPAVVAVRGCCC